MALRTCWMPGFIASDPLAQPLVRISDDAIAQDNDALLRDYLAEDYVFHGPVGDLAGSTVHHSWTRRRAGDHQAARDEWGGWFGVNSAHPFENPSGLTNALEFLVVSTIRRPAPLPAAHLQVPR